MLDLASMQVMPAIGNNLSAAPVGTTSSELPYNQGIFMVIGGLTAIAWYNIAELNVQIFTTFKSRRGLYFWALLISGWGCVLHALGFILKFFVKTTPILSVTIITIGWWSMVSGQAVVLYSRLHLVLNKPRILHAVLGMIITNAIILHIPTTVLTFGSNLTDDPVYPKVFNVYERIQLVMFCLQEFVISGIYVFATLKLLKPVYNSRTRKTMTQLIVINLIIISMDMVLLAMQFSNYYYIQASVKATIYSIKLKLEFGVLNSLMALAKATIEQHVESAPSGAVTGPSKSGEFIGRHFLREKVNIDQQQRHPKSTSFGLRRGAPRKNSLRMSGRAASDGSMTPDWMPSVQRDIAIDVEHVQDDIPTIVEPTAAWTPRNQQLLAFPPQRQSIISGTDAPFMSLTPRPTSLAEDSDESGDSVPQYSSRRPSDA